MPVRVIKQIFENLDEIIVRVPSALPNAYGFERPVFHPYRRCIGVFVCELVNHFDKNKNLIRKINETTRFGVYYDANEKYYYIYLTGADITKKYGLQAREYIEIIFQSIERIMTREEKRLFRRKVITETKAIPIFPERIVEDLEDFV